MPTIQQFGKQLVQTGDLDPVYIGLTAIDDQKQLMRWLVAYLCFYHAGAASYLSEYKGDGFWAKMLEAAYNTNCPLGKDAHWPRSAERRHFRGKAAVHAVEQLWERYPVPEDFITYIVGGGPKFAGVSKRVTEHYLFGKWVAYKAADLCERVLRCKIDFSTSETMMYAEPMAGALLVAGVENLKGIPAAMTAVTKLTERLLKQMSYLKAPPWNDRPFGIAELETTFCKFHSYHKGHYQVGKDIREVREGLNHWSHVSHTASLMFMSMPPEVGCQKRLW